MGIQLKNDGDNTLDNLGVEVPEMVENKVFSRQMNPEDVNDLPAYTGPSVIPTSNGVATAAKRANLVAKIIGLIVVVIACFGIVKGVQYMTGSGGKDITEELSKSEEEIAKDLGLTFTESADAVRMVPQYAKGKITVKSGGDLNVVYIGNKQAGVCTDSRKYRFFGVGINDPEQTALKKTTYVYDDSMVVLNDLLGGKSKTYFYYNKKNNDSLVLTISDRTNRVVAMTYFTDYKKATSQLSSISD